MSADLSPSVESVRDHARKTSFHASDPTASRLQPPCNHASYPTASSLQPPSNILAFQNAAFLAFQPAASNLPFL